MVKYGLLRFVVGQDVEVYSGEGYYLFTSTILYFSPCGAFAYVEGDMFGPFKVSLDRITPALIQ